MADAASQSVPSRNRQRQNRTAEMKVAEINKELKLCTAYLYRKDGCSQGDMCNNVHICRNYILCSCRANPCQFTHDLSKHQFQALIRRRFGIKKLQGAMLQKFRKLFADTIRNPCEKEDLSKEEMEENRMHCQEKLMEFLLSFATEEESLTEENNNDSDDSEIVDSHKNMYGRGSDANKSSQSRRQSSGHKVQPHKSKQPSICSFFLRGSCKFSPHQGFRHCDSPFQWQIRCHSTSKWLDLTWRANKDVEEKFCDVNNVEFRGPILACDGSKNGCLFIITLTFGVEDFPVTSKDCQTLEVRRLSTLSSGQASGWFKGHATYWIWYWMDEDGKWVQYPNSDENASITSSLSIERKFLNYRNKKGSPRIDVTTRLGKYCLIFARMQQECSIDGCVQIQPVTRRPSKYNPPEKAEQTSGQGAQQYEQPPATGQQMEAKEPTTKKKTKVHLPPAKKIDCTSCQDTNAETKAHDHANLSKKVDEVISRHDKKQMMQNPHSEPSDTHVPPLLKKKPIPKPHSSKKKSHSMDLLSVVSPHDKVAVNVSETKTSIISQKRESRRESSSIDKITSHPLKFATQSKIIPANSKAPKGTEIQTEEPEASVLYHPKSLEVEMWPKQPGEREKFPEVTYRRDVFSEPKQEVITSFQQPNKEHGFSVDWQEEVKAVRPKPRDLSSSTEPARTSPPTQTCESQLICALRNHKEITDICAYFLRDRCKHDDDKFSHKRHFKTPYQWQFRDTRIQDSEWQNIPSLENDTVEKAFCNPDVPHVDLSGFVGKLYSCVYFEETPMCASYMYPNIHIRRLTTSSSILKSNWEKAFSTEWIWYWQDERKKWIMYSDQNMKGTKAGIDSAAIEQKYQDFENMQGDSSVHFTAGNQKYILDFTGMTQTNVGYGTVREVRRRPKFVPMEERKKLSRELSQAQNTKGNTPSMWNFMTTDDNIKLVTLTNYVDPEYINVANLFWDTMDDKGSIVSIQRIQNKELWEDFSRMKERMTKKNRGVAVHQKQLFHGTTSQKTAQGICHQNFDWRLSGSNVGTRYGHGSYFARDASYSHSYTNRDTKGFRYMFVAEVLTGSFTSGQPEYSRPPPKHPMNSHDLYDSCVDDVSNPRIYVIFEKSQAYPQYLIAYKEKSSHQMWGQPTNVNASAGSNPSYQKPQPTSSNTSAASANKGCTIQ